MKRLKTAKEPLSPQWLVFIVSSLPNVGIVLNLLPTHVYIRFSKDEVESWQDAKGLIASILATIGAAAGTAISVGSPLGSVVGGGLGKVLTEAIFLGIIRAHKVSGEKGLIILIRTLELVAAVNPSIAMLMRIKVGDDILGTHPFLDAIGRQDSWNEI